MLLIKGAWQLLMFMHWNIYCTFVELNVYVVSVSIVWIGAHINWGLAKSTSSSWHRNWKQSKGVHECWSLGSWWNRDICIIKIIFYTLDFGVMFLLHFHVLKCIAFVCFYSLVDGGSAIVLRRCKAERVASWWVPSEFGPSWKSRENADTTWCVHRVRCMSNV